MNKDTAKIISNIFSTIAIEENLVYSFLFIYYSDRKVEKRVIKAF